MKHISIVAALLLASASLQAGEQLASLHSVEPVSQTAEVKNEAKPEMVAPVGNVQFAAKQLRMVTPCKLVISDAKGRVIYYNENATYLDCSRWRAGMYTARIDDSATFLFTL